MNKQVFNILIICSWLFAAIHTHAIADNASAIAQKAAITLGHSEVIHSRILSEKREVYIHLPPMYKEFPDKKFPVLYTLDGNTHFNRVVGTVDWLSDISGMIPQHIVVAILNTDRFRDFSPSRPADAEPDSVAGGANRFIQFLDKELIPHIDKNYRTKPFRILAGHSFGGLFAIHTQQTTNQLFQAYIAQSPHLIYDELELIKRVKQTLTNKKASPSFLFMSLGDEATRIDSYNQLVDVFKQQAPSTMEWHSQLYPTDNHMSTPSKTLHDALLAMRNYAGWTVKDSIAKQGISTVHKHYKKLSKQFGYDIPTPEHVINTQGYAYLNEKRYKQALVWFKENIKLYPESFNAHDSLSEAYEQVGDLAKAIKLQRQSVKLATEQKSPRVRLYQRRLTELEAKASQKS
jgi:uncharacterized protein